MYSNISLMSKQLQKNPNGLNLDSLAGCTCHQFSLVLSSDSFQRNRRSPSSIALTQSCQATLLFFIFGRFQGPHSKACDLYCRDDIFIQFEIKVFSSV